MDTIILEQPVKNSVAIQHKKSACIQRAIHLQWVWDDFDSNILSIVQVIDII